MIQLLNTIRTQRRISAWALLCVWIWCLFSATFALAMTMNAMPTDAMHIEQTANGLASEQAFGGAQTVEATDEVQGQLESGTECCPEETDLLTSQVHQSNLVLPVLLSYFVLALLALGRNFFCFSTTRRLIQPASVRLHALYCSYLN